MAALLLLQPLLQRLHQLVEAAKRLDQLFLLLGQVLFGEPAQPFLGEVGDIDGVLAGERLDALEDMRKHLVEAVDMALVLHQRGAGEVIKAFDIIVDQPGLQPFQQRQIFPQRNGNPRGFQFEEEGEELSALQSCYSADRTR